MKTKTEKNKTEQKFNHWVEQHGGREQHQVVDRVSHQGLKYLVFVRVLRMVGREQHQVVDRVILSRLS